MGKLVGFSIHPRPFFVHVPRGQLYRVAQLWIVAQLFTAKKLTIDARVCKL